MTSHTVPSEHWNAACDLAAAGTIVAYSTCLEEEPPVEECLRDLRNEGLMVLYAIELARSRSLPVNEFECMGLLYRLAAEVYLTLSHDADVADASQIVLRLVEGRETPDPDGLIQRAHEAWDRINWEASS